MAGGRTAKQISSISRWNALARLTVLGGCFFAGALGGFFFSGLGGQSAELSDYLQRCFLSAAAGESAAPPLVSVIWEVLRWPLAVFLLGFTALGAVGIPALLAARGFLLSFAAATFARLFGLPGAAAALAVFGVTVFLSVPVLFVVANDSFRAALGRLPDPAPQPASLSGRLAALAPCAGLLALAAALQRIVMPALFTAVCARFFAG